MANFSAQFLGHRKLQDRVTYSKELIENVKRDLSKRQTCNRSDLLASVIPA